MVEQSELRQAHANLLACYKDIRKEFTDLDDPTLSRFLGKYNTPQFRQQVKGNGDGYTMRSVPRSVDEILRADHVVLIVMNSPKLDRDSDFRLHVSLPNISYWRDGMKGKGLRSEARLRSDLAKFQFLVWEQDCGVHGELIKGGSNSQALENERLLIDQRPRLRQLLREQAQKSEEWLWTCMEWLESLDRKLILLTHNRSKRVPKPPIPQLMSDERVLHIPTKLFGQRSCTVMDEIICEIS